MSNPSIYVNAGDDTSQLQRWGLRRRSDPVLRAVRLQLRLNRDLARTQRHILRRQLGPYRTVQLLENYHEIRDSGSTNLIFWNQHTRIWKICELKELNVIVACGADWSVLIRGTTQLKNGHDVRIEINDPRAGGRVRIWHYITVEELVTSMVGNDAANRVVAYEQLRKALWAIRHPWLSIFIR